MAILFAVSHNCPCYLVLDAFFSVAAFFVCANIIPSSIKSRGLKCWSRPRAIMSVIFQHHTNGLTPGPQPFYGEKVHLKECFDHPHLFRKLNAMSMGKLKPSK